MDAEIEKIIDDLWNSGLSRVSKKEKPAARPRLGDLVDLIVPQDRIISMLESNPTLSSLIYYAAYASANRNAYIIIRKLNMPAEYFWKYEFWPKERAFTTLQKVINRVFTAILNENKEGLLSLDDVDAEKMRFTVSFQECAECAGLNAARQLCYYHAGTFAGIISGLMSREMDGFETTCTATGNKQCTFVIGKREDPEIAVKLTDYLAPKKLGIKIEDRVRDGLRKNATRSLGRLVNIEYYQLMVSNSILSNPALFSASSFSVGVEAGARLASILQETYRGNPLEMMNQYYRQLRQLEIEAIESGADTIITLTECAEVVPALQRKEMLGFLLGELQGMFSVFTGKNLTCAESWFEKGALKARLSPKV